MLAEEFSDLYVFHLRGDIRKNMLSKGAAREGQNVFASGSMTGISIAVLVKNPNASKAGNIHFHDIGPDLTTKEKLGMIQKFGSIDGITKAGGWAAITPDTKNDWLDQVDQNFDTFMLMGTGERGGAGEPTVFELASLGINSNRDQWVYNSSPKTLTTHVGKLIDAYNAELDAGTPLAEATTDPKQIKWSSSLTARYERASFRLASSIKWRHRDRDHPP